MCIAVWKPQGIELTEETLHNCWNRNPDGAGFMYSENGKLTVVKGLMTYDDFEAAYAPHADKNAVLHFRIATHGGVNAENTHPFIIHDNLAMVHNGVIHNVATPDATRSDTWHFTEMYLKKYHTHWQDEEFQALVESYIGHSKLIFMDNEGNVKIYKQNLGNWNSDCWFSNTSWETPKYVAPKVYNSPYYGRSKADMSNLRIGDTVSLNYRTLLVNPHNVNDGTWFEVGHEVKIKHFGTGINMTVYDEKTKFQCELPAWKVDIVDEPFAFDATEFKDDSCVVTNAWATSSDFKKGDAVVLTKNYNHFRLGDILVVDSVTDKFVISRDDKGRFYSLPKAVVEQAAYLLI